MCFVYECISSKLPVSEPTHPSYRGMQREGKYIYFFFDSMEDEFFGNWLKLQKNLVYVKRYEFEPHRWQIFSKIINVGNFCIRTVSNGESYPLNRKSESADNLTIFLTTGTSFGSGIHPTTKASLIALERVFSFARCNTVFDCGTGSGILGIASALLGAEQVICSDISPISIRDARKNAVLNNVSERLLFLVGNGVSCVMPSKIDLLITNIEWPSLNQVLRTQKWQEYNLLVISGFPRFLKNIVLGLISKTHLPVSRIQVEGWEAMILKKR